MKTILLQSLGGIPFALIFGLAGMIMLYFGAPLLGLPLVVLVVSCCLVIVPPVWFLKKLPNIEYVLTNRKVLIKTGFSRNALWTSELNKISGFIVKTGVGDKIVGTGKLYPITAEYPYAPKLRVYTRNGLGNLRKVYNLTTGVYDEIYETELYRRSMSHPHLEGVKKPFEVKQVFDQSIGITKIAAKVQLQYSMVQKIGLFAGALLVFVGLLILAWGYLTGYTPYVSYEGGYTFIDYVAIFGYGLIVPGILILVLTTKSLLYSRFT